MGYLHSWPVYLAITVLFTSLFNISVKLSAGKIHPVSGFLIIQAIAFFVSLAFFCFLYGQNHKSLFSGTLSGVVYAALAGTMIAIVNVAIFYVYNLGGTLSVAGSIGRLGPALILFLAGILFFKEDMNTQKLIGLALSCIGIYLLFRTNDAS